VPGARAFAAQRRMWKLTGNVASRSARHEPAEPPADREGESAPDDDLNDRAAQRASHCAQTAASASSETAGSGWIAAMCVRATNT